MGSEISKTYAVDETPTGTAGLSGMWKLHQAVHRETDEAVTVWIFNPTVAFNELKDKAVKGVLLDCMRRDLKSMKEMRHPAIPEVIEAYDVGEKKSASLLTTASNKMAIVTKPVVCSLANILEGRGPTDLSAQEDYEIARGLCGVAEALQYVHTICRKVHLSLSPESVVLTELGVWKLAGFGFSTEIGLPCPYFRVQGVNSGVGKLCGPWRTQPPLEYSSPEATSSGDISPLSDLFSFGLFMHRFLAPGGPNSPDADLLKLRRDEYHHMVEAHQIACSNAQCVVLRSSVQALIQCLVSVDPNARTHFVQLIAHPLFHSPYVMALRTIDSLGYRSAHEAASALSAVREPVSSFPLRLQCKCILPSLLDSAARFQNGKLWHSVLPLVGDILGKMDSTDVVAKGKHGIQGKLILATGSDEPETLRHIVDLLPLFIEKCSRGFIQDSVLPALCRSITKEGYPRLQQAALEAVALTSFSMMIKAESLEKDILPTVCWLAVKSKDINMRPKALISLSKFSCHLPLKCIIEKVLPMLKFVVENDKTVAVQLLCLEIFEAIANHIPESAIVITNVLPSTVPILANKNLTVEQYEMVVGKVRTLLDSAIDGQRDARSCNFEMKKTHTTKKPPLSSRNFSKEPKPNLPAAGGPSCNTSEKHKSPLPLKDSSSAFDMLGGRNSTSKTAPINDQGNTDFNIDQFTWQEVKKATVSSTSPELASNLQFLQPISSTMGTGAVMPSISPLAMTTTNDINTKRSTTTTTANGTVPLAFGGALRGGAGAATAAIPQESGHDGSGLFSSRAVTRNAVIKDQVTISIATDGALLPTIPPLPEYCQQKHQQRVPHLNHTTAEPEDPFAFLMSPGSS